MILTGFGRGMRITERMAKRLPTESDVLELDVNDPEAARGGRRRPRRALGAPRRRAARHRLRPRRRARRPVPEHPERFGDRRLRDERVLDEGPGGGAAAAARARRGAWRRRPGLRRHRGVAGLRLGRRLQGGPGVDQPLPGARPRARGARAPTSSPPARCRPWRPRHRGLRGPGRDLGRQAPLGWDLADPTPVADACLFLLSPLARAITGEILHVDGGVHAMGAAPVDRVVR